MAGPLRGYSYDYTDFRQACRAFKPSELLPALAATPLAFGLPPYPRNQAIRGPPWALAATARESLLYGNEFRSSTPEDRAPFSFEGGASLRREPTCSVELSSPLHRAHPLRRRLRRQDKQACHHVLGFIHLGVGAIEQLLHDRAHQRSRTRPRRKSTRRQRLRISQRSCLCAARPRIVLLFQVNRPTGALAHSTGGSGNASPRGHTGGKPNRSRGVMGSSVKRTESWTMVARRDIPGQSVTG